MYALYLNPVTSNAENYIAVAISEYQQALEDLLRENACDIVLQDGYWRSFKQGPLYNYNPPKMNGYNCFNAPEGIVKVPDKDELYNEFLHLNFSHAIRI